MRIGLLAIGLLWGNTGFTQLPPPPPLIPVPNPPTLPPAVTSGEALEPEVNIIQRPEARIEEYRAKGQLYMIKITPLIGRPYYLVDHDGDGSFETRSFELAPPPLPQWFLFRW